MSRRHAQRDNIIVAGAATRGYLVVVVIDMAGLAFETDMRAFSRDAGGFVVVLGLFIIGRASGIQGRCTEDKRRQQQQG